MAMTITVTATEDLVTINGVVCRMWDGTTARGIKVQAAIVRVAPLGPESDSEAYAQEAAASGMIPPSDPRLQAQDIRDVPGQAVREQERWANDIHERGYPGGE